MQNLFYELQMQYHIFSEATLKSLFKLTTYSVRCGPAQDLRFSAINPKFLGYWLGIYALEYYKFPQMLFTTTLVNLLFGS